MVKSEKPKTSKPTWSMKILPIILVVTFSVCIVVCVIDGLGIAQVNNIDKFWEAFFIILALYVGLIGGGNINQQ